MKLAYGKKAQIRFQDEAEYYFALGFLASAKHTSLHWEHNEDQGAWGSEGRIHCYGDISIVPSAFTITGGRPGVSGRQRICRAAVQHAPLRQGKVRPKCAADQEHRAWRLSGGLRPGPGGLTSRQAP